MKQRARNDFATKPKLHLLAKVTLICCLLPFTFNLGPIVLSPSRVLFLISVPYLVIRLFSGAYGKIVFVDIMMFLSVIWLGMAIGYNNPESAITFVGSNAILLLGGYLTARATVRAPSDLYAFGNFLIVAALLTLPFALFEAVTSNAIIPRLFDMLPGVQGYPDTNAEPRLGLERAQVVFAHPIHYGLFCAFSLPFIFIGRELTLSFMARTALCFLVTVCAVLSLSTAAFTAIILQFGLISWAYLCKKVMNIKANVWRLLVFASIFVYFVLDVVSNRPAYLAVFQTLSFNSSTVYMRTLIFEYGMAQVDKTPFFGVGFNGWDRPVWMSDSIDNYYLFLAVIYGFPSALFFMISAWASVYYTSKAKFLWGSTAFLSRRSWGVTMVSVLFTIATVSVWGDMLSIIYFILGAGIWMHTYEVVPQEENSSPKNNKSRLRYVRKE